MKYYAIINEAQVGPMELPELVKAGLMPDTYVWCKGMADWKQANEVADICRFFRNRIFDLMHPTAPASDTDAEPAQIMPMADEDYKGMKRREFYNAVGQQIQQTATNPDDEKISNNIPPKPLPTAIIILSIILFFPFGIPALIYSRRAKNLWAAGLAEESYQASTASKMYAGIAISLGVIAYSMLIQWI